MNESELLEMAAKAHGNCKYFNDAWRCAETGYREFNPLNDDGDALRLAVKLKLQVDCLPRKTEVFLPDRESSESVNIDNDPFACTRLAIVAAAYEIGKSL